MKGTIFAVALNHRSQLDAWQEAFQQSPYKAPPKTAVWFIKPRNTVIGCGEPIPFPQGEKVLSGATVALIVGKTATKVREEDAQSTSPDMRWLTTSACRKRAFTARQSKQNVVMDSAPLAKPWLSAMSII